MSDPAAEVTGDRRNDVDMLSDVRETLVRCRMNYGSPGRILRI